MRINGEGDHVARAIDHIEAMRPEISLKTAKLTWLHDPNCPRLLDSEDICQCRPNVLANGTVIEIPSTVWGGRYISNMCFEQMGLFDEEWGD